MIELKAIQRLLLVHLVYCQFQALHELREENAKLKSTNNKNNHVQIKSLETVLKLKDREIETQREQFEQKIQGLKKDSETCSDDLKGCTKARLASLNSRNLALENQKAELEGTFQSTLEEANKRNGELQLQVDAKTRHCTKLETKLAACQRTQTLDTKITSLESSIRQLEEENKTLRGANSTLSQELQNCKEALHRNDAEIKLTDCQARKSVCEDNLKTTSNALQTENLNLRNQITGLKSTIVQLRDSEAQSAASSSLLITKNGHLLGELTSLREGNQRLINENRSLRAETNQLKSKLNNTTKNTGALEAENRNLHQKNSDLESTIETLRKINHELAVVNNVLTTQKTDCETTLNTATSEKNKYENMYNELYRKHQENTKQIELFDECRQSEEHLTRELEIRNKREREIIGGRN